MGTRPNTKEIPQKTTKRAATLPTEADAIIKNDTKRKVPSKNTKAIQERKGIPPQKTEAAIKRQSIDKQNEILPQEERRKGRWAAIDGEGGRAGGY